MEQSKNNYYTESESGKKVKLIIQVCLAGDIFILILEDFFLFHYNEELMTS